MQGYWCVFLLPWLVACGDNQTYDDSPHLAAGVAVESVNLYQTAEIPLAAGGETLTERNAPIIRGRDAAVRVTLRGTAAAASVPVTVHVQLTTGSATRVHTADLTILAESAASTATIEIPGEHIGVGTSLSVAVYERDGAPLRDGNTSQAVWPRGYSLPLEPRDPGIFHLVLVPIEMPGGNVVNFTPPLVDSIAADVRSQLAIREVELTIHEPIAWVGDVTQRADWSSFILDLGYLREQDGVADNVVYYGVLPVTGAGLAGLAATLSQDRFWRVAMGILGEVDSSVMVHELGHVLGRPHAPCGNPGGPDPSYPYADASIGAPGWDLRTREFKDPAEVHDVMSYCVPSWTSDYTFAATYRAIQSFNATATGARSGTRRGVHAYAVDSQRATYLGLRSLPVAERTGTAARQAHASGLEVVRFYDSSATLVFSERPLSNGVSVPGIGIVSVTGGAR